MSFHFFHYKSIDLFVLWLNQYLIWGRWEAILRENEQKLFFYHDLFPIYANVFWIHTIFFIYYIFFLCPTYNIVQNTITYLKKSFKTTQLAETGTDPAMPFNVSLPNEFSITIKETPEVSLLLIY